MATSFNIAALTAYTDELSMDLVAKAVLNTDLLSFTDLRTGMTSGSFTINLVDSELPVSALSCGGYPGDGQVVYTQVPVTIDSLQSKTTLCPEDLRSVYQSAFMSAGTGNDFIPFEEVISESYASKLTKATEDYLINGFGATNGLKAQITGANGATVPAGAVAWTVANAVEQALDLYDAIDESVINRDDIIMVVSPANYRTLVRALVAQNLYNYPAVDSNEIIMLPGTNAKIVQSSGLVGSANVFAGPSKFIIAATGLQDELDSFRFQYSVSADAVLFKAAWRIGVGVSQVNVFATNDLA
tara:strand:+ start:696 stop:1595 length:900 start_codon:yes stop_codon:yes gene_type:complete